MEQGKRERPHLERVLMVCGLQNAGKSKLLRQMFYDNRLGTNGKLSQPKVIPIIGISNERCLFVRCTSPHEAGESLCDFLNNLDHDMARSWRNYWRFNFACAIQPCANATTPDAVEICREFKKRLQPERIRIIQIDPRQDEKPGKLLSIQQIDELREIDVEILTLDRRINDKYKGNGMILADFFDFT